MTLIGEYPTNDEYLSQTNDTIFDVAQVAVNLAMAVITDYGDVLEIAKDALFSYGDWENIDLPKELKRELYVRNYGEEEVQAMEDIGELTYEQ